MYSNYAVTTIKLQLNKIPEQYLEQIWNTKVMYYVFEFWIVDVDILIPTRGLIPCLKCST